MLYLHAWPSDDVIVYFRYNVVCKKFCICTLGTRMMGLFIFVIVLFVRSVVSARLTLGCWDCLFSARLTLGWWDCLFSARLTLGWWDCLFSARSILGWWCYLFLLCVVCKKCCICTLYTRMLWLFIFVVMLFVRSVVSALDTQMTRLFIFCTIDTRMLGLFIFVVMLFVRSVVSARLQLGCWDCLFSL